MGVLIRYQSCVCLLQQSRFRLVMRRRVAAAFTWSLTLHLLSLQVEFLHLLPCGNRWSAQPPCQAAMEAVRGF